MADPNTQTQEAAAPAATEEINEFEALLNTQFKPKSDSAKSAVHSAVRTLAEQALGSTKLISDDVIASIQSIIGELDRKLSEQVNKIIHHEDFKALEEAGAGSPIW